MSFLTGNEGKVLGIAIGALVANAVLTFGNLCFTGLRRSAT